MWLTPPSLTLWDVESGAQWPCTIRKHTTAAGHEHSDIVGWGKYAVNKAAQVGDVDMMELAEEPEAGSIVMQVALLHTEVARSLNETEALVEGVRLLGPSKWAEIKKLTVSGICSLLTNRSAVDLKDKWRNLTRVARLSKAVLKSRSHKSTSDIPLELLLTVKELMELAKVEAE
ncbi:hypothetical protein D9Q98_002288 [Chlorella vulgaris]|uniref:Myb-like domain-containing protein n=1 Tax=Chlorella vulgaris TaxID=3077 RepID=A0A9D4TW67_CHLVU|nr:hypothetical protein D9Q98_002288 [Chlorella vulgaris]